MKKTYLALALAMAVGAPAAMAQDYQIEGRLGFATGDDVDVINLGGTFHFETVSTDNRPLAEAAFLGHNSNISLGYIKEDADFGDEDSIDLSAQVWLEQLYVEVGLTKWDDDIEDGTDWAVGVGFMLEPNLLLKATIRDGDGYNKSVFGIGAKTVRDLGGEQSLNLEGELFTSDGEQTLAIGGDFYPDRKLSVGAALAFHTESGRDTGFEVRARYFFTPTFSVKAAYQDSYSRFGGEDSIGLEAAMRF